MTTRWTPRRIAAGVGRRVKRMVSGWPPPDAETPPTLSIIVPIYNVEAYLAECLDSIVEQDFGDFELLIVDDGSPDGSIEIARAYAERDDRIRIVTRPNGGLGAARNTGVREATGRYLTFIDSDDALPPEALSTLVGSAERSGSDMVVGSVRRFTADDTWKPSWVDTLHAAPRTGITIDDFPALVRNNYTWCKLYRRDFWDEHAAAFREGVSYEDQPLITRLYIAARGIDVLTEVVYRYRAREDSSSISQQTASVTDLRDRISAWRESHEIFSVQASPEVYDAWLQTLFDAHFHWYLRSPGTTDDEYWAELQSSIVELAAHASQAIWDAAMPQHRVPIELARQGRRADLQEFIRRDGQRIGRFPADATDNGIRLELPYFDDPQLDDALFLLRPQQLMLSHEVQRFHWVDGATMRIAGWAYIRRLDLTERESRPTLILHHERTGEEHTFEPVGSPDPGYRPPDEDDWADYPGAAFEFVVPMAEVVGSDAQDGDVWTLRLRVDAAGFRAEDTVTRVKRSSSAGVIRAGELNGGDMVSVDWQLHSPFRLRLSRLRVEAVDVEFEGRTLRGRLAGPQAAEVARLRVLAPSGQLAAEAAVTDGRFTLDVPHPPALPNAKPGSVLRSRVEVELGSGEWIPVVRHRAPEFSEPQFSELGAAAVECTRTGELGIVDWPMAVYADSVEITENETARVSGRVYAPNPEALSLRLKSKKTEVDSAAVEVADGRFTAEIALRYAEYRFGEVPLPAVNHDFSCDVAADDGSTTVPLLVSRELSNQLPIAVDTDRLEGRVLRGPRNLVRVSLVRPLGDAAGRCRQRRLRWQTTNQVSAEQRAGLLIRSYFGESATDCGLGLQDELLRRGADIDIYWSVQDHSIPVPDGATPVIQNSYEWYRLLDSAKYYLDNMYQPEYHYKPDGQVIIQTFHGYPFKKMGHPHWEQMQFSQARIASYDRRAAEWDYLVSPASYATPLLARDFAYDGEILEIGYPRNDILFDPRSDEIRQRVRRSLGIGDHQTAVLYAPTFRDYLSPDDMQAAMVDFLDLEAAANALGRDYVLLVRGHAFNARTSKRVEATDGVRDVTDYPLVSDLYLAADAAVVDYSSLRFDFGATGKPMIFHVPDIERYREDRGWLFEFEPTAPGPLVSTTEEVVECVDELDSVVTKYAAAYDTFRREYLDREDGRASARLVDAVFVPRGDAPPAQ